VTGNVLLNLGIPCSIGSLLSFGKFILSIEVEISARLTDLLVVRIRY
jgi:hypothetical protein